MPASRGVHGPGEMTIAAGLDRPRAGDVDRVVAPDDHFGAEFAEVLHQVVGERIVIVDHEESS